MMPNPPSRDVARTTLAVLFIGIFIGTSFWVLHPFLKALTWATMIVVATWPFMLSLQERLWGRRGLAVAVMTAVLLLVFIVPFTFAVLSLVEHAGDIAHLVKSLAAAIQSPPPPWVEHLPLVGPGLAERWRHLATAGAGELSGRLAPYARNLAREAVAQAGSFGMMILQFLLTVIISAVLYAHGETAGRGVCRFARRLAGPNGEDAVFLAARAIRGVALGVILTALIQAFLGGVGLAAAGVPAAMVLAAIIFVLCVAQLGPALVLVPAVVWLFWKEEPWWGTAMIFWTLFVGIIDNFLRPLLIRRGTDLPLLLIFAGVIGGLLAFGVIGLFIGPVVLAVTYTLLKEWILLGEREKEASSSDAAD